MSLLRTLRNRANGQELPEEPEIERFGADGEEQVYEVLASAFDTVIRSPALPHKELFLEKDFLVIYKGFPFILEIKHWKGEIGQCGDKFYQEKDNGVRKTVKSPVGTTAQFIKRMKAYYKLKGGLGNYLKGFTEPIFIMTPLNILGEISTPISMAFRHFGNVQAVFCFALDFNSR